MLGKSKTGSVALIAVVAAVAVGLGLWKWQSLRGNAVADAEMPETVATITTQSRPYRPTTTAIGTVIALRSVTLRNEVAGTVASVALDSGTVVEAGAVLLRLDTSVEEADLAAQQAEAALARRRLERMQQLVQKKATSVESLEQAQAQHDVLVAQIGRTRAVIARKVMRAPFRARVGIADVHPGQYLEEGTLLTTLQGVDDAVHVDFTVSQQVAAGLRGNSEIEIIDTAPIAARVLAVDARVDPATRNATVRARVDTAQAQARALAPGASVRVRIPGAEAREAIIVPSSALRRGPEGEHLFVIATDAKGTSRAQLRRVRAGTVLGDEVLIESGLKAGERVATAGSFKLRDNALVILADATAAPLAAQ